MFSELNFIAKITTRGGDRMAKQKLTYDYSKLKGKIKEVFGTQEAFADQIGLSDRSVSLKLASQRSWKQDEIINSIDVLKLTTDDIKPYFFVVKVQ